MKIRRRRRIKNKYRYLNKLFYRRKKHYFTSRRNKKCVNKKQYTLEIVRRTYWKYNFKIKKRLRYIRLKVRRVRVRIAHRTIIKKRRTRVKYKSRRFYKKPKKPVWKGHYRNGKYRRMKPKNVFLIEENYNIKKKKNYRLL